jgi:hypothetical protein
VSGGVITGLEPVMPQTTLMTANGAKHNFAAGACDFSQVFKADIRD